MKYVTFKSLKIKNFLSIGEEYVCIDFEKGINIITGINRDKEDRRNGVGKSTIADALYFAIFGTTLRELKKEFIINNITQSTCEVQLDFDVNQNGAINNYVILRTLSPSRLLLFKDSNDITLDTIANTNKYIEDVLSSTPEIFRNCVLMTLNDTIPFMSKSKAEKRKFIEQIFNLQIFSEMMSNLREDQNNIKRDLDIENAKYTETKNSIANITLQKSNKEKEKQAKITLTKSKISDNKQEISKIEEDLKNVVIIDEKEKNEDIEKYTKALTKVEEMCNDTLNKITTAKTEIKNKKEQFDKMGTQEQTCPTCLRPITEHDTQTIENEKNTAKASIKKLAEVVSVEISNIGGLENKKSKIKAHISNLNKDVKNAAVQETTCKANKKRIEDLQNLNKQLEDTIDNTVADLTLFDNIIKDSETKLKSTADNIDSIKKKANLLDVVKFVISEEGIKSFLVKKILQNFNAKLAFYLKKMDSNSICIFNEYFEEEILNEKGKMCLYNNFSGAERKAIDLSCLFSFIDMRKTQGDVYYNISIYDELFDTSLDQRGVELVIDILKERVSQYNESIFIISHRKESIKAVDGNIIFLEKQNGITKRINFID
jgi:DNA repair exonuclease SbcCD ATPase subunit